MHLGYSDRAGNVSQRTVHPLGLAQKGTTWYLIAGTDEGLRTFRVSRVRSLELTDEPVVRPEGFELAQSWEEVVERVDQLRSPVEVSALADPDVVDALRWTFEGQVVVTEAPAGGRVPLTVRGPRVDMIAGQLSGSAVVSRWWRPLRPAGCWPTSGRNSWPRTPTAGKPGAAKRRSQP